MMEQLYNELEAMALQYHQLEMTADHTIRLEACNCDTQCIEEVMRIAKLAALYEVIIQWDGESIEIH